MGLELLAKLVPEEVPHGVPDVVGAADAIRADVVLVARDLDEQPADLAVRRGAGERRDFQEAGVVAVADELFERGLRLRLVRREVLAVGGVEQVDVVLARAEARVDDLAHFLQARRGDRAAGAGDAEELLFLEFPGFRGVRDEHQLQMTVLAAQALDRPEEERLGNLPLALAHAARYVEQQDDDGLHRRLLALRRAADSADRRR